jgi:hypothetical protein
VRQGCCGALAGRRPGKGRRLGSPILWIGLRGGRLARRGTNEWLAIEIFWSSEVFSLRGRCGARRDFVERRLKRRKRDSSDDIWWRLLSTVVILSLARGIPPQCLKE